MTVGAVTRAIVGNKIRNTAQRHCGFEAIGVADDPVGHIAAITPAGHAHVILIDPGISFQRHIETIHDVEVIFAAPFADNAALELLAIAGRAARIRKQHRIAFRGVNLKLVIPVDAVLSGGSAVNAENQRILLACLPPDRLNEKAINVPIICALISEALDLGQLPLLP